MVLNCRVQLHTTLLLLLCRLAIYSHAAAHRSPEMPEGKNSKKWPLLRCFYKMVRGAATSLGSWTVSLLLALKKGESSQFVFFFFTQHLRILCLKILQKVIIFFPCADLLMYGC